MMTVLIDMDAIILLLKKNVFIISNIVLALVQKFNYKNALRNNKKIDFSMH